ncbi:MAG TPA: VanZ family protein [Panacibacter sp.]|nr:VanZ family protein [Panacibacter sp.]
MARSSTQRKIILSVLLITCMAVLTKYILFKNSATYSKKYFGLEFSKKNWKEGLVKANFEPLRTIHLMQGNNVSTVYRIENLAGNIVGFIPLGILFPLLFPFFRSIWKTTLLVFVISLAFESIQLCTGLGIFDVDDLILNVAGGLTGYILYKIMGWLFAGQ